MKRIFIYLFFYLLSQQTLSAQFITDTVLTLQNIEIQGQRFPIINSGSVKQLSVQENITGGLGSASDVLRQLPAVTLGYRRNNILQRIHKNNSTY
jgi:hypothetical protein